MSLYDEKIIVPALNELDNLLSQTSLTDREKLRAWEIARKYLMDYSVASYALNCDSVVNTVVNSENLMNIVANSETAMNIVANSETAMNSIWNSPYRWTYFDSSYIDTVYDNSSTARSILRNILLNNPDIFGDNSIVAYYPFEGNANDYSGNGYNGTWSGTEQYDSGIIGQAAKFPGGNVPESIAATIPMQYCVSVWFRFDGVGATPWPTIVDFGNYYTSTGYGLWTSSNTSNLYLRINNSYNNFTGFSCNIGQWYSGILVYTDGVLKLYVNGSFVASISGTPNDTSRFVVGNRSAPDDTYTDECFTGLIDSVRIFNRVLTDTEVQRLYKLEYLARN